MQTIFFKIKIWVVDNKSILTNFTVAVFLMSTIILFYRREKCRADDISNDYLLPLIKGDSILLAVVSNSVLKDSLAKKNLVNNVLLIQEEKKHHKAIFTNLFSYYYATIIILQLLTVATGIFTFLIANKGWKDTNQTLKLTFLILAGATTYYGLFPSIFNQKTTIEKNLSSYLEYSNASSAPQNNKIDN